MDGGGTHQRNQFKRINLLCHQGTQSVVRIRQYRLIQPFAVELEYLLLQLYIRLLQRLKTILKG